MPQDYIHEPYGFFQGSPAPGVRQPWGRVSFPLVPPNQLQRDKTVTCVTKLQGDNAITAAHVDQRLAIDLAITDKGLVEEAVVAVTPAAEAAIDQGQSSLLAGRRFR